MKLQLFSVLILMSTVMSEIMAKADVEEPGYTYVEASLGFPWFMFLVFTVLVLIPFVLIVVLAWRKQPENENLSDQNTSD